MVHAHDAMIAFHEGDKGERAHDAGRIKGFRPGHILIEMDLALATIEVNIDHSV